MHFKNLFWAKLSVFSIVELPTKGYFDYIIATSGLALNMIEFLLFAVIILELFRGAIQFWHEISQNVFVLLLISFAESNLLKGNFIMV